MYPVRKFDDEEKAYSEKLRAKMTEVERLVRCIAPGRERSLALTKLDEALFWANAAIAAEDDNKNAAMTAQAEKAVREYGRNDELAEKAEEVEKLRARAQAEREVTENGVRIEVPKEIRADLHFDVYDEIHRATAKAIDDFLYKTLDTAYAKAK